MCNGGMTLIYPCVKRCRSPMLPYRNIGRGGGVTPLSSWFMIHACMRFSLCQHYPIFIVLLFWLKKSESWMPKECILYVDHMDMIVACMM